MKGTIKRRTQIIYMLFCIIFLFPAKGKSQDTLNYIFIGHSYQFGNDFGTPDFRIKQIDFTQFDGIWLGGDLCQETTLENLTLQRTDSIYCLSCPETLWALGNHDFRNGNLNWIENITGRSTFYAKTIGTFTVIVMNTNFVPFDCDPLDRQYQLISNVCDTISNSSHLILLMHHYVHNGVPGLPPIAAANLNLDHWDSNCYDSNSTFVNSIYPKLIAVKERGVQPVCIIGDFGYYRKTLDVETPNGIQYLGCGLYKNQPNDNVLLLKYIVSEQKLTWEYKLINDLIGLNK